MLSKLANIFKKAEQTMTVDPPRPVPNTPLEILVPEGAQLSEPPKFAGKFISYLVAANTQSVTIDIESESGHVHASDGELKKFLGLVSGAGQTATLIWHCKSVMYPPSDENSIGKMGCMQQSTLYMFSVIEHSPLPKLRWEFVRFERPIVG